MSQDIEDSRRRGAGLGADRAERSPDVESAPGHHCRHCREAPGQRGCPQLRGCPVLGLHPACPVPGRRGRRVRAAVRRPRTSPRAISADTADLIVRLRKELTDQGLDAGPVTIAWHLEHHHQTRVSPATISRHLTRRGLITPEPKKRPKSSYIRFQADQPNECWQADFTHYPLANGAGTEILTWLDDHSRYALSVTAHQRITGPIVLTAFQAAIAAYGVRPPP